MQANTNYLRADLVEVLGFDSSGTMLFPFGAKLGLMDEVEDF
jgi:hypothetical protein